MVIVRLLVLVLVLVLVTAVGVVIAIGVVIAVGVVVAAAAEPPPPAASLYFTLYTLHFILYALYQRHRLLDDKARATTYWLSALKLFKRYLYFDTSSVIERSPRAPTFPCLARCAIARRAP